MYLGHNLVNIMLSKLKDKTLKGFCWEKVCMRVNGMWQFDYIKSRECLDTFFIKEFLITSLNFYTSHSTQAKPLSLLLTTQANINLIIVLI